MACICEGNKVLRELQHMRELAKKAAMLEDATFVLFASGGTYSFCREDEWIDDSKGKKVELIYP